MTETHTLFRPAWLAGVDPLPRMVAEGLALVGTREKVGPGDNPVIMAWARELGLADAYTADAVPWCGLFMAIVAKRAGKPAPSNPLWARNWTKFGIVPPGGVAGLGDVLVFQRAGGGGHVGLYLGQDASAFHVLGGNQGDAVNIARIARSRCIAVRRPVYRIQPDSVRQYNVDARGGLSSNEA